MSLAISNAFIQTTPIRVVGMALGYCAYERFAQIINAKSSVVHTNYLPYMGLISGALAITQRTIVASGWAQRLLLLYSNQVRRSHLFTNSTPALVRILKRSPTYCLLV